eukprot:2261826-Prymnesium_polylepis.1
MCMPLRLRASAAPPLLGGSTAGRGQRRGRCGQHRGRRDQPRVLDDERHASVVRRAQQLAE